MLTCTFAAASRRFAAYVPDLEGIYCDNSSLRSPRDSPSAHLVMRSHASDRTPRQAAWIASKLSLWGEGDLDGWLEWRIEPLHIVAPCDFLDPRVMMMVGDNAGWADAVKHRCLVLPNQISHGVLPFDRPGPYIDELLDGLALPVSRRWSRNDPEMLERVTARAGRSMGTTSSTTTSGTSPSAISMNGHCGRTGPSRRSRGPS